MNNRSFHSNARSFRTSVMNAFCGIGAAAVMLLANTLAMPSRSLR